MTVLRGGGLYFYVNKSATSSTLPESTHMGKIRPSRSPMSENLPLFILLFFQASLTGKIHDLPSPPLNLN